MSALKAERSPALRDYVAFVRRHSPDGVSKLKSFIESWNIVGLSSKRLPIPYGDHFATFRTAEGALLFTSQPYHGFPNGDQLDAYTSFAREYRVGGSVDPSDAWWDPKACLLTFMYAMDPGCDLYFLRYEIAALFPRIEERMEMNRHDPEGARALINALLRDTRKLKERTDRAFAELEAAR
jgi:hypothetical protein